jgi:cytochrome c biogenesis protein ResB
MASAHSRTGRRIGRVDLPDPIYPIWRWLTSVRIAIILIAFIALVSLIGVVIPQVPVQAQGDAAAIAQHINDQRGTWGFATDILADFPWFYNTNGGIFNLFNQPYWFLLVAILSLSITTCTVSRFPPIWRTVRRPQRRVNDAYYERARHRFAFTTPADPAAIVRTFRKHQ